jgi:hypothetical protein
VWRDDGWGTLAEAMDATRPIVAAFSITDAKGQKHRTWEAIVDEARMP